MECRKQARGIELRCAKDHGLTVSDIFASEDSLDKGVLIWIYLKEPEISITVPQEDCIRWVVVDVGGTWQVPIQELFLSCFSNSWQCLIHKVVVLL